MDKRYQVFVSSTFTDLREERQACVQALLSLDHFPAGMELFPASDDDAFELIKSVIDDSDYYVIIIGARYGSVNSDGMSYTEMEYRYAREQRKPVLAFLHATPESLPISKSDKSEELSQKLVVLCEDIKKSHHVKFWSSPADLQAKIIQSIAAETKRNPQEGWVRSGSAASPTRLAQLISENQRLREELERARLDAPSGVETLAKGDEKYKVTLYHNTFSAVEHVDVFLSWDTIFREIGPLMIKEASERALQNRMRQEFILYSDEAIGWPVNRTSISNEAFDTIKIQLVALGLIKKSDIKHGVQDNQTYWSLTPYGEKYLMQLRAVKSDRIRESGGQVEVFTYGYRLDGKY